MSVAVGSDRPPLAGRYELQQLLGRGGMGAVFLARDLKYDRLVAVKFLTRQPPGSAGTERFHAEIRTAARLSHRNILTLHDSGEADGRLYYVMPYVPGASLADRIKRQGRIPVDESLRIARQVAGALSYAHAHGIIHRDIKPDNVLLDADGHVYVADFGLARALSAARSTRLTGTGYVVGSPLYMSPEQAVDDADLDARSDLYSLGCVLFEMLAGIPPFAGSSAPDTVRRHLSEAPPLLRGIRADVPASVERVVAELLEKSPERRCASADIVARNLDIELARVAGRTVPVARAPSNNKRRVVAAVTVLLTVALGIVVVWGAPGVIASRLFAAPPDAELVAVLPLAWDAPVSDAQREDAVLYSSFARWDGLRIVPRTAVAEAVGERLDTDPLTVREALGAARSIGAGRFVLGRATSFGDSIQLDISVHDAARDGVVERRVNTRLRRGDETAIALLVDSLMFGRVTWDGETRPGIGTRSSAARRLYGDGHAALAAWDLASADTLFAAAAKQDPGFGRAHLWLGQVRNWAGEPVVRWSAAAARASQEAASLTERERLLASGLVALTEERWADACSAYRAVLEADARDFAGLIGSGECRRRDLRVVRNARSPSGWSMRSSMHAAVRAYAEAYAMLPSRFTAMRGPAATRLAAVLFTHRNTAWRAFDDSGATYIALPEWRADTLALVPWPEGREVAIEAEAWDHALSAHRVLYHDIARGWASAFPREPEALFAVGMALEMLADANALVMVRQARDEAVDPQQQLRLGIHEVWMLVRSGVPDRTDDLVRASALADSLLRTSARHPPADPRLVRRLAGLALLAGRPEVAVRLSEEASRTLGVTERAAAQLLFFAAAGGPPHRITEHERAVEQSIRAGVQPEMQGRARIDAMEQAAFLAFPVRSLALTTSPLALRSPVARAQSAFAGGDPRSAAALLRRARDARRASRDLVSIDVAYAEAALYAALGDTAQATALLDAALASLADAQPGTLEDPARAAALVRAMALRADLAAADGSDTARQWAAAVLALWDRGEPVVRSTLDRMNRIENR